MRIVAQTMTCVAREAVVAGQALAQALWLGGEGRESCQNLASVLLVINVHLTVAGHLSRSTNTAVC